MRDGAIVKSAPAAVCCTKRCEFHGKVVVNWFRYNTWTPLNFHRRNEPRLDKGQGSLNTQSGGNLDDSISVGCSDGNKVRHG